MRQGNTALTVLLAFSASSAATAQAGPAPAGESRPADSAAMERILAAQADSGFSGVVLVARGDSILLRRAYGRHGPALSPRSAFWIGSMTKGFTAAAVLRLVDSGRLSFDDSIGALLPAVARGKAGITIRRLLTHTAGLSGSYSGGGVRHREAAVRAILAPPLERPGGFRYSDDDYELLAALIEVVTHRPWEEYVAKKVLQPAGLGRTGFWCVRGPGVPIPVAGADGSASRCASPGDPGDDWGHRGANGMSSTADDLLRWSHFLGRDQRLPGTASPLLRSPRVHVRTEGDVDVAYGAGVRLYQRDGRITEVLHSGASDDGHTGVVRVLSSGLTIVVLSNAGRHRATTWSSYVAYLLAPPPRR